MSAQRLNARSTRRVARVTGLPVVRAWGHGGYVHAFVTAGHLHGWISLKDGSWGIDASPGHYTSCHETGPNGVFPDGKPAPLSPVEALAWADVRQVCPYDDMDAGDRKASLERLSDGTLTSNRSRDLPPPGDPGQMRTRRTLS